MTSGVPFFEILCENDNFRFGFVLFGLDFSLNVLNMFVNRVSFADDGHAVEKKSGVHIKSAG